MNTNKEKLTFIFPEMQVLLIEGADIVCASVTIPGVSEETQPGQGEWLPID